MVACVCDGFGVTGVMIMLEEQRRRLDTELHFDNPNSAAFSSDNVAVQVSETNAVVIVQ
jgi:hypothetical protein